VTADFLTMFDARQWVARLQRSAELRPVTRGATLRRVVCLVLAGAIYATIPTVPGWPPPHTASDDYMPAAVALGFTLALLVVFWAIWRQNRAALVNV
jgi:hypothetical protein